MASERMMQAIGRMERALDRLEDIAQAPSSRPTSAVPGVDDAARGRAVEALRSLDSLIAELKVRG
jgi:hypothetical protein